MLDTISNWFYNQKINTSIFLTLFTTLLLSIALSGYLLFNFQNKTYEKYLITDHERILTLLAQSLQVPLWNYSHTMGQGIIDAIAKDPRVVEITVWDVDNNNVFLHTFFPDRLKGTIYSQTVPVMIKNKRFGEVTVKLSSYGMEQELRTVFQSSIFFFTIQFLISLLLLLLIFYLKITKPLQSLLAYISKISDHQLHAKAIWQHNDEISMIGKAFERAKQTITNMAITDSLTGVSNHYMLRQLLQQSFRNMLQQGQNFTLVLIDINNFKQINDYYGHLKGDIVLKELATLIKENIEPGDYFGRWSGEEFMLIYQNKTPQDIENGIIALNQNIEKTLFDVAITLSCSFGITGFQDNDTSIEQIIKRADKALSQAKGSYSNNVIIT